MVQSFKQIDNNGFYTGAEGFFDICPSINYAPFGWGDQIFIAPRFTGGQWTEGATQEQITASQTLDPHLLELYTCYNNYILFCRSVGLSDQASASQFQTLAQKMIANNEANQAYQMLIQAQFLITNIIQNGGCYDSIVFHPEIIQEGS